ncbi:MAG: hypothetical protein EP344_16520 [Bacteroidetes bacterium]|nr:MAG: hypothetical protein EP344_16520 [Bacteroidota bacterium]
MKHSLFLILLIAALGSCTDPADNLERRAECYVRYLVPEGQLLAELSLRREFEDQKQNGLQPITSPGGARYRGTLMEQVTLRGVAYQIEQLGGYPSTHTFEWNDAKGAPRSFTMELAAIPSFSFSPSPISLKKPATLTWEGAPLEKGEALVFMWESVDGRLTVPMDIIGTPGQKQIDFPAAQLSKLQPGIWTLYLVRKKQVRSKVENTDVIGLMEYYTRVDTITIQN